MKKTPKKFIRALSLLLITALLALAAPPARAAETTAQEIADGVLGYELARAGAADAQVWLDGALADGAGGTSEWYVLALRQYDASLNFDTYAAALSAALAEKTIPAAATRERCALALLAAREMQHPYIASTLADAVGEQGVMSWVFGLHLLNNGAASPAHTAREIVDAILARQLADGGWAVSGERGDADVTAMALQALAPRREDEGVDAAIARALAFLSAAQGESGAYSSYGAENAESCAQVIIALCALDIDIADARFVKNGVSALDALLRFRLPSGGFCHVEGGAESHLATVQAFCAAVALRRAERGYGAFYLFDDAATPTAVRTAPGYKLWACLGVLGAAALTALILTLAGKRHRKNYLFVLVLAALGVAFVLLTSFQSAADFYTAPAPAGESAGRVTLAISCDTAAAKGGADYLPADGVILAETEFDLAPGETVYELLVAAARTYAIQMESEGGAALAYVSGIGHLYEFAFGELSGWMFFVNGASPSVGCGEYVLADGDAVEWRYTCALGDDLEGTHGLA